MGTRVSIESTGYAPAFLSVVLLTTVGCVARETKQIPPEQPPQRGGTLTLIQEVPETLDPVSSDTVQSALVIGQIFDSLVTTDAMMNLSPALAESWRVSDEGRSFSFSLRQGVRFHDGTLLDADDVIFTFERILRSGGDRESLVRQYMLEIEGAREFAQGEADSVRGLAAPTPLTVRIRLQHPYAPFLHVLTSDAAGIVPRSTIEAIGAEAFARAPVGTGPFRMARWDSAGILLEANPDYFGGPALLEAVRIRFPELGAVVDPDASGFRRIPDGTHAFEIPFELPFERGDEGDSGWVVQRYHELDIGFLGLRVSREPLSRLWLRRAIAMSIDRERVVAAAADRLHPARGFLPPGILSQLSDGSPIPSDPAGARLLLRENGYPDGAGIEPIALYYNDTRPWTELVANRIVADLGEVGIRVDPRPGDWDHMSAFLLSDEPGMYVMNWLADMNDADSFLRPLFSSEGRDNYTRFTDRRLDRLLARAVRDPQPGTRQLQYREAEQRVLDLAPIVPLYHSRRSIARRPEVAGLDLGPFGLTRLELEKVWLTDRGRS